MTEVLAPVPLWLRILRNPLSRILLFGLAFIGFSLLAYRLLPPADMKIDALLRDGGVELWRHAIRAIAPAVLAYWLLVRVVEGRKISELAPRKLPSALVGWLVGMGIMLVTAALLALFGVYRVNGVHEGVNLLAPLIVLALAPGIAEEIVARGVLYRVVEDGLGTWAALAISAIFFGGMHLGNPNASPWSSTAIAIEAGLLLGLAYAWTRSLWFCFGLHAAWNFTQGPLLDIPVSGIELTGWLDASVSGPEWLSGGAFGAEASVLTVFLCTSLAAWFGWRALRCGHIRPPFWRRDEATRERIEGRTERNASENAV